MFRVDDHQLPDDICENCGLDFSPADSDAVTFRAYCSTECELNDRANVERADRRDDSIDDTNEDHDRGMAELHRELQQVENGGALTAA